MKRKRSGISMKQIDKLWSHEQECYDALAIRLIADKTQERASGT
jgi:hypothetical protein